MRSKTAYWEKRLKNATHCSFQRAYSSKVLPKKKIDAIKVVPAEDAVKFGGPKPDTPKFAALFRGSTEIFVVHFQPYSEEEVENIPDKKTKAALESLRQQENLKLDDVEVMDPAELFKPDSSREPYDPHKLSKLKGREIQFPANLLSSFIQAAWSHSTENEFMGWVTGKVEEKKQNKKETSKVVVANGLFLPCRALASGQSGNRGEGELPGQMLQFMEDSESIVVGWIHSHPTFDSFCHQWIATPSSCSSGSLSWLLPSWLTRRRNHVWCDWRLKAWKRWQHALRIQGLFTNTLWNTTPWSLTFPTLCTILAKTRSWPSLTRTTSKSPSVEKCSKHTLLSCLTYIIK